MLWARPRLVAPVRRLHPIVQGGEQQAPPPAVRTALESDGGLDQSLIHKLAAQILNVADAAASVAEVIPSVLAGVGGGLPSGLRPTGTRPPAGTERHHRKALVGILRVDRRPLRPAKVRPLLRPGVAVQPHDERVGRLGGVGSGEGRVYVQWHAVERGDARLDRALTEAHAVAGDTVDPIKHAINLGRRRGQGGVVRLRAPRENEKRDAADEKGKPLHGRRL